MAKTRRQHKKRTSKTKRAQRAQGGQGGPGDQIDKLSVAELIEYNQQDPCSTLSGLIGHKKTEIPYRKNKIYERMLKQANKLAHKKVDDDRSAIVGEKQVLRSIMNELRDVVFEAPDEEDYAEPISSDDMSVFEDIMMSVNIGKLCHITKRIEEPDFFHNNVLGR